MIIKMKKIIAIILAITCAFAMFSCQEKKADPIDTLNAMYKASAPTKVVTNTTEVLGSITLSGTSTLKTGKIDGKIATTYTYSYQELREIEDGISSIEKPWKEVAGSKEYLEDKGVRINGGKWDEDGFNFAPSTGSIIVKITKDNTTDFVADEATKTITFKVAAEKTAEVFGEDNAIAADVTVTVTHDGAVVTSTALSYTLESSEDEYPDAVVTVKVDYTYDLEEITID